MMTQVGLQLDPVQQKNDNVHVVDLCRAAKKGDEDDVSAILRNLSNDEKIAVLNGHDDKGFTALHYTAEKNLEGVMKILLDNGADPEALTVKKFKKVLTDCDHKQIQPTREETKVTSLHLAAGNGHSEAVKLLLDAGSQVDRNDGSHQTPLHWASREGQEKTVLFLLAKNADVTRRNGENWTPIMEASRAGHTATVKALLDHAKMYDKNIVNDSERNSEDDGNGWTSLHLSSNYGHAQTVEVLVRGGANVNEQSDTNYTPLLLACKEGHVPIVIFLLKQSADVTTKDKLNWTAAHHACRNGEVNVVEILLDHDSATFSSLHEAVSSPLMLAIQNGHEDVTNAIANCDTWKELFEELQNGTTPWKEVIKQLPDAAITVLDRCTTENEFPKSHTEYSVTFDYTLIEQDDSCTCHMDGYCTGYHPEHSLKLMAQSKNLKVLTHPLLTYLLWRKWKTTMLIYIIGTLFHAAFLGVLTCLAVIAPNPQREQCQAAATETVNTSSSVVCGQSRPVIIGMAVAIGIFVLIRTVVEVYMMCRNPKAYFLTLANWMEITMLICSAIFVIVINIDFPCVKSWGWQIGAIAVFLAWCDLLVFIKFLPYVGVYVRIFQKILRKFIETALLAVVLVIGFGFGLYMIFFEPDITRSPFSTPLQALLSVISYSTGAYNYDFIFRLLPDGNEEANKIPFPTVSYILWILFIIIMPILLNNFLIAVAVSSIAEKKLAKLEVAFVAHKIDLILNIEAIFPCCCRLKSEKVYPNRASLLKKWCFGTQMFAESDELREIKKLHKEIKRSQEDLKQLLKQLLQATTTQQQNNVSG